jgi:uncharacterized protein (TIRG00374 family)
MNSFRQKIIISIFSLVGIILLWISISKINLSDLFIIIQKIHWWKAFFIALFPFLSFSIAALRLYLIINSIDGKNLPFRYAFEYLFIGASISLLFPSASISGETTKILLFRSMGISTERTLASIFWDSLTRFSMNLIGNFTLLAFVLTGGIIFYNAWISLGLIWAIGILIILIIIFFRFFQKGGFFISISRWFFSESNLFKNIDQFDRYISGFSRRAQLISITFIISLVGYIWEIIQEWFIWHSLGIDMPIIGIFFWHIITTSLRILPAPGGIGFIEGAAIFISRLFNVSPETGISFIILGRIRDMVILLSGLFFLALERALFKLKRANFEKEK